MGISDLFFRAFAVTAYSDFSTKLQELYKTLFGHTFEDVHNAMADVVATKECFWEMVRLQKISLSSSSDNNEVMAYDDKDDLPF
ncbi:hypothetical protein [Phocaeicola coprophilus]|uniref:hypothetical protein n=1 Tax=Phocaeicola coprophilus TaxID=387090 RepID=UPI00255C6D68|nr:hypothetical protein [Phocaeicola coprophilus]